jgi:P27 family predicted phage terminase small subunit
MGLRGPAPTPTAIARARGGPRRKNRRNEPVVDVESPGCPEWLKGEAKKEWDRIVPLLLQRHTLALGDRGQLAGMCFWWGEFVKARSAINKRRRFKLHLIEHPRVIMGQAWKEYAKAAREFGLSPASKARVQSEPVKKTEAPKIEQPILRIAE